MGFIEKMVNLGFTEPGRWEEDNDTLTRCVVRYHHFLDLMAAMPGKFAVPTLVRVVTCLEEAYLLNSLSPVPSEGYRFGLAHPPTVVHFLVRATSNARRNTLFLILSFQSEVEGYHRDRKSGIWSALSACSNDPCFPQVPDHDDKVGQGALSTAYDNTAEAWKVRLPFSLTPNSFTESSFRNDLEFRTPSVGASRLSKH